MEISPDYSWAYFNLASLYYDDGYYENAKDYLKKTLELNPKDDNASLILSKILKKEDDLNGALKILRSAISNNPYNGDLNYAISQIYKVIGQKEEYEYFLKEALNNQEIEQMIDIINKSTGKYPVDFALSIIKEYCF